MANCGTPYTLEDLDKLKAAHASGVRRVEFQDRVVHYATRAEMAATIKDLEAELCPATKPARSNGRIVQTFTNKGFNAIS